MVIEGKVVFWLRLRGVVNEIEDVIADVDLKTIANEACDDALPMSMKEDLKITAHEDYDGRKHADGAEADENFIVIKADTKVDRCCFPFLYLLEYDPCKSHVLVF